MPIRNDTIIIPLFLSFLLHAMLLIVPSLSFFHRVKLQEYRMVQLVDAVPKGNFGKGRPRSHSNEIRVPQNNTAAPAAEAQPRVAEANDAGEEGEGAGSPDGEKYFDSFLPFFKVSRLPEFVTQAKPVYPPKEKLQGKESEVLVEVYIDTEGRPRKVVVVKSGGQEFDAATVDAVNKSLFHPALAQDGKPVPVRVRIPFKFELD